jgi:hypothetical protein
MSKGNQNTEGNKKYNFPFQFNALQLLGSLASNTTGLATEGTLQQVLGAIQDGQDFESKIVIDNNGNGTTYLEVRIWNPDTQTWEAPLYYAAGSNTGVPAGSLVAPIIYINNSTVLANIYSELQTLNTVDFATESTSSAIDTNTSAGVRTPFFIRTSAASTLAPATYSVSVSNVGSADGDFLGTTIKPGETLNFDSGGIKNTYPALTFDYDATGTEFIIIGNM